MFLALRVRHPAAPPARHWSPASEPRQPAESHGSSDHTVIRSYGGLALRRLPRLPDRSLLAAHLPGIEAKLKPGRVREKCYIYGIAAGVFRESPLHSTLTEFRAIRAASPGVHRCVPTHCRCFPGNPRGQRFLGNCAHARIEWGNSAPAPGLSGAILCPRHSAPTPGLSGAIRNSVPTPGLSGAILCPRQD